VCGSDCKGGWKGDWRMGDAPAAECHSLSCPPLGDDHLKRGEPARCGQCGRQACVAGGNCQVASRCGCLGCPLLSREGCVTAGPSLPSQPSSSSTARAWCVGATSQPSTRWTLRTTCACCWRARPSGPQSATCTRGTRGAAWRTSWQHEPNTSTNLGHPQTPPASAVHHSGPIGAAPDPNAGVSWPLHWCLCCCQCAKSPHTHLSDPLKP